MLVELKQRLTIYTTVASSFFTRDKLYGINKSRGQSWLSGTRLCDCKTDWLWVRSPLEEMKYLLKFIFPFLCSGIEVKRGIEFCHSTLIAFRIRQKVGNGVS